ncbi:nose resistant to fluoxetine protein 6-like isoform X2 [Homalodisca vitripennis]|uniref:nose resistant to fluoxetine protein 6-like isoform X2 n=1 Tax=Homalodisca vitripennis TaxID=197043 RepID=UPI001EEACEF4|nr:nose resistant to fluoxetine protein 6-like isoform X2 [Homalodisca vitripennis]
MRADIVVVLLMYHMLQKAGCRESDSVSIHKLSSELPLANMMEWFAHLYIPVHAVSEECRAHSNHLLLSVLRGEIWALQILDSCTKLPPGLTGSHFMDFGHYSRCVSVYEPDQLFKGQHILVETRGIFLPEIYSYFGREVGDGSQASGEITFSICVPSSCSVEDVETHLKYHLASINVFSGDLDLKCSTAEPLLFEIKLFTAMALLMIVVGLVIWSTSYEYFRICSKPKSEMLKAFSVMDNWKYLTETKTLSEGVEVTCVSGIRVLSVAVTVLAHRLKLSTETSSFSIQVPNNVSMFSEFENGFLGAEIFFLIGGVVRSYNFFRDRHRGRPFSIVSSILIRYLRYTPALAGVMLFNYGLLVVCGQGPLWQRFTSHPVGACCQFWWTGLLHIANYVNPTAMCVHHSWYLASDFQLFLASPLFLIPLYFRPQLGLMMLAVTSIASVVALFFHSHSSAIYSEKMTGLSSHRGNNLISGNNITSHSRASPYLLGLALGYILFMVHNNRLHLRLSKTNIYWGWGVVVGLLAIVFMTSTIPTAYDPELTHWLYPVWNVFSRFVVASTAAWVILVCSLGHGEWLNQLLSWRGFQMLSKLVLGVYLVHFNVIIVQLFQMNQPFELNYVDVVSLSSPAAVDQLQYWTVKLTSKKTLRSHCAFCKL